jgi:signal transduction histidine kinase
MHVDELRNLFLFQDLTDAQLGEVFDAGEEVPFEERTELFHEGAPADDWWILLEGQIHLLRRVGREEPKVVRTMDRPGLWAGGFRAWDAEGSYLATGRGAGPGRMFRVPAQELGWMVRNWFPFAVHLIEGFFQTVRNLEAMSRQRQALAALGELAAGLAHELNNPASATARAVDALQTTGDTMLSSLTHLAEQSLLAEQFVALDLMRRDLDPTALASAPLELADREDVLAEWLEAHGVTDGWKIAPVLAAAAVDAQWCDRAYAVLNDQHLESGLEWVASALSAQSLLREVKESTSRISSLVDSIKSYTQLDRASQQVIDVTEGIESTLVMLRHKIGPIVVERDFAPDLPTIEAFPAELNQVWTNLLTNAVDALDGSGTIRISTAADGDNVVVVFADDGPGMPAEVQDRAFEPFFTTKETGKGTGLGLDISRRIIIDRHKGDISIDSEPGRTEFTVTLPITPP